MSFVLFNKSFYLLLSILFATYSSIYASTNDSLFSNNKIEEKDFLKLKIPSFTISPSSYLLQYAGDIGKISIGTGWEYGKEKKWSTDFLIGYVPKYDTDRIKITFTLRQTITPWHISVNKKLNYNPLRAGMYISTTLGKQFWFSAPEKYPTDYYTFSTKLRANLFIGQSFSLTLFDHSKYIKKVDFYYDLHTNDLMLLSRIQNKSLGKFDYLGLALGVKLRI